MTRITKIVAILALLISIVGCGSSSKKQEKVVTDFFEEIKNGDIRGLEKLMTKRVNDDIAIIDFMDSIKDAFTWDYGKKWNKERKAFTKEVFENVVKSYEIKDVKVDDDEATIKVKGKRIKFENFYNDDSFIEDEKSLSDFYDAKSEAIDDYLDGKYTFDEYSDTVDELYEKYAPEYFGAMLEQIEDLGTTSFTMTFTLTENKDGEWLIKKISSRKEWPVFNEYDYDEEYDDTYDFETYKVDQEKCKPENTLLGKGHLLDSYKNEKEVETAFEFLDYNITNGAGVEMDAYGTLILSEPLKIEIEVAGNVGETFVLTIEDDKSNVIFLESITLTEAHMVITKELTGFDSATTNLYLQLLVEEGYNKEYNFGDQFGYLFIWNDN